MTENLENKTEKTAKKGSNLEIALTVVGLCLGAIISNVIMERYCPGSNYMAPVMIGSTIAGGSIGYFAHKAYKILKTSS